MPAGVPDAHLIREIRADRCRRRRGGLGADDDPTDGGTDRAAGHAGKLGGEPGHRLVVGCRLTGRSVPTPGPGFVDLGGVR